LGFSSPLDWGIGKRWHQPQLEQGRFSVGYYAADYYAAELSARMRIVPAQKPLSLLPREFKENSLQKAPERAKPYQYRQSSWRA